MRIDVMGDSAQSVDEMWSDDPIQILHFPFRSHFQKFQTDVHKIMLKYHNKHPYNSVTSLVSFYENFNKQSLPLLEFYEKVHQPSIEKDSQNCIGRTLYLRGKLIKHLKTEYPDLDTYLNVVSSNRYQSPNIPERYHNAPPEDSAMLKQHACLALKFTLESEKRLGCVIMDSGFLIDFPIVVMEDGQAPNTGKIELASWDGLKIYEFEYFNNNYIYWLDQKTSSTSTGEKKVKTVHHWFYVGKKLQKVLQIERRNQLFDYHGLVYAALGGAEAAIYNALGANSTFFASMRKENPELKDVKNPYRYVRHEIPFEYVLSDEHPRNQEWEEVLEKIGEKFHYDGGFMDLLKRYSKLATDRDFVQELSRVSLEWSTKIESSFDS